jgi:hypothetical protein
MPGSLNAQTGLELVVDLADGHGRHFAASCREPLLSMSVF